MAIEFSSNYKNIVDDVNKMPGAKWFEGLRFNFAENLLRVRSDKPAIHFQSENNSKNTRFKYDLHGLTLKEANEKVREIVFECIKKNYNQ